MNDPHALAIGKRVPEALGTSVGLSKTRPQVGRSDVGGVSRCVSRLLVPALLAFFGLGLLATVLDGGAWKTQVDFERVGPNLAAGIVSMTLLATWLAFMRWREDHDVLSGRMAIAMPCLIWVSQSIRSPLLLTESSARRVPSALGVGVGIVGTWLITCDLVRRHRPVTQSYAAGLLLSIVSATSIAAAIRWGLDGHPEFQSDVRRLAATTAFPALWGSLGLLMVASARAPRAALRRCLGAALVLLSLAQIVAPPGLGTTESGRAMAAGGAGFVSVLLLVAGLGYNLRQSSDAQRRRLFAAEFDAAQGADRLEAERLLNSRKAHDQKAALLSIEAVIKLLESSEAIDPGARQRLCDAATDELRRLRGNAPDSVESDLRELVEPVVALANAAGANVMMKIRPGLTVNAGPELVDIVRNLISNAVRHGGDADVTIEARRLDYGFVELSVTDSGPGIRSSRRFDLFEPGRSSGGEDCSGLGLHSARSLLRDMGGDLQLDRSYVGGARFTARIPAFGAVKPTTHV